MATVRTFYLVSGLTAIIARNAKFCTELDHEHIDKIGNSVHKKFKHGDDAQC